MQHATSNKRHLHRVQWYVGNHGSISSPIQICDFRYRPLGFAYEFAGWTNPPPSRHPACPLSTPFGGHNRSLLALGCDVSAALSAGPFVRALAKNIIIKYILLKLI